jgi:hypothetical protein
MSDTQQVSVRIPIALRAKIQAIADRNGISFSRALWITLELGEQKMTGIYGGSILAYVNRPSEIHRAEVTQ